MSVQNQIFTLTGTFTAPSAMLNGSVTAIVCGGPGGHTLATEPGGAGALVKGTIALAPGATLAITVASGRLGFHNGGTGGLGKGVGGAGGVGGGSSAVQAAGVLQFEAGGGGGGGATGQTGYFGSFGGKGGIPGLTGPNGTPNPYSAFGGVGGNGTTNGSGGGPGSGGGGGLNGSSGGPGSSGNGGNGGNGDQTAGSADGGGGGGGGGYAGGGGGGGGCGFGGGGGGGGGASSFMIAGATSTGFITGGGGSTASVTIQYTIADAPLQPTLLTPAPASYLDSFAAGVPVSWKYQAGVDSGLQSAYALRVKTSSGAYQYWNNGTGALQATIVWNTLVGAYSVLIPAAILADGVTYNWSVATQSSIGGLTMTGGFASDSTFTAQAMPTISGLSPSGPISTLTPTVAWTDTLGGGLSQTAYRVCVYNQAASAIGGFAPGLTTPQWDSGTISSASTSMVIPSGAGLVNGVAYGVYLQITETGPISSAWTASPFSVAFDAPAAPVLIAALGTDPATGAQWSVLTVVDQDNLVSLADSSFESGIGSFYNVANSTLTASSAQFDDQLNSLAQKSIASGDMTIETGTGLYPVQVGATYSGTIASRAAVSARTCKATLAFYTAGGALIGSRSAGTGVADGTTAWTVATVTATAPASAAFCAVGRTVVGTGAANEVHYLDEVGLIAGNPLPWTVGGYAGVANAEVQFSDDGVTWADLRYGSVVDVNNVTLQAVTWDWEQPIGVARQYRARMSGVLNSQPVSGPWSAVVSTTGSSPWWMMVDPLQPSGGTVTLADGTTGVNPGAFIVHFEDDPFTQESDETQGITYGFGRDLPIVATDAVHGWQFPVTFICTSDGEWQDLLAARLMQRTLLLKSPLTGDAYFVRFMGTMTPKLMVSDQNPASRQVTLSMVEVEAP